MMFLIKVASENNKLWFVRTNASSSQHLQSFSDIAIMCSELYVKHHVTLLRFLHFLLPLMETKASFWVTDYLDAWCLISCGFCQLYCSLEAIGSAIPSRNTHKRFHSISIIMILLIFTIAFISRNHVLSVHVLWTVLDYMVSLFWGLQPISGVVSYLAYMFRHVWLIITTYWLQSRLVSSSKFNN